MVVERSGMAVKASWAAVKGPWAVVESAGAAVNRWATTVTRRAAALTAPPGRVPNGRESEHGYEHHCEGCPVYLHVVETGSGTLGIQLIGGRRRAHL
jgi:hypothetical protein